MAGESHVEVEQLLRAGLENGVDAVPVVFKERRRAVCRDNGDAVLVQPLAGIIYAYVGYCAAADVVVADGNLQGLDSAGGIDGAAVAPGLFLVALAGIHQDMRPAGQYVEILYWRKVCGAQQGNAGVT